MERRVSTISCCAVAACLAGGVVVSCGQGISDGRGEFFATQTFDVPGGRMQVKGATLDLWPGSVAGPADITMRRYDQVAPAGAVGPVFEIELPSADTLQLDPRLGIQTTPAVLGSARATIGFLSPMASGLPLWVPNSTTTILDGCPESALCGPVQIQSFTNPGGATTPQSPPTSVLRLAIIMKCESRADCLSNQSCQSGACQQCLSPSDCNP
jgi:hypothetical protein